jgi:hypothetical protein
MTEPAEIPTSACLGIGDVYAVRSNHGAPPYLVACMSDGQWACSCPAEHNKLRVGGRFCRPIREVIALRVRNPIGPLGCERKEDA